MNYALATAAAGRPRRQSALPATPGSLGAGAAYEVVEPAAAPRSTVARPGGGRDAWWPTADYAPPSPASQIPAAPASPVRRVNTAELQFLGALGLFTTKLPPPSGTEVYPEDSFTLAELSLDITRTKIGGTP